MDKMKKKGNKYLNLLQKKKKKEVLRKYTELWKELRVRLEKYIINQMNMVKISWKPNLIPMIICL